MICPLSRAYIYVIYFPKKGFTPSQAGFFLLIFRSKQCEGLLFQTFTPGVRMGRAVNDGANNKMMLNSGCFKVSPRVKGCGGGVKA